MPIPSVEPTPLPPRELRLSAPLDAQDASYFAASARIDSLSLSSMNGSPGQESDPLNLVRSNHVLNTCYSPNLSVLLPQPLLEEPHRDLDHLIRLRQIERVPVGVR